MDNNKQEEEKKRYKLRTLRADDKEWEELKYNRQKYQKSWNLFIRYINQLIKKDNG